MTERQRIHAVELSPAGLRGDDGPYCRRFRADRSGDRLRRCRKDWTHDIPNERNAGIHLMRAQLLIAQRLAGWGKLP